ncbi:hypothetical protein BP5796_00364 [Coleophoma crateriformis]|uniref:Uncharacterized protein n=1 Tax=Coleophoma crateriformis TaxID=565419 RepID=A0A3D8T847_9HELO|nr:hypothetical protein BP5796_00364 [Coleophoma crateriformis]
MSNLRDPAARRRIELNPITTSLATHQVHQTPTSAISGTSLSTPFGYNPSTYTPSSSVQEYNPLQWTSSPSSQATQHSSHFRTQSTYDPEVVVPGPPPYSPPRSNRTSLNAAEESSSASAAPPGSRGELSLGNVHDPSSEPVFAPPPNSRRTASTDRPRNLLNLSPFSRRAAPEIPHLAINIGREIVTRRPPPLTLQSTEPVGTNIDDDVLLEGSRPPAARRAVSAGATSTPSSSRSRGSSSSRWEPGMPLPPPPPGPPPQSRSQSMGRSSDQVNSPPVRRSLAPLSNLGPVPPTPAGWVDEDIVNRGRSPNRGLTIDTSSIASSTKSGTATESNSGSSSSGLARSRALRGEPKSIRERRSESRTGKNVAPPEPSNNPWAESITPSDIVVPTNGLTQRPTITRSTPKSAGSRQTETPKTSDLSQRNTPVQPNSGSRGSTPRPLNSSARIDAPTPPFSPNHSRATFMEGSPAVPPKALPTPPPQSSLTLGSPPVRPLSHILHMPNHETAMPAPLTPSRPTSRQSNNSLVLRASPADHFARAAAERHKAFAEKEATASNDEERVRIFADFIVTESRLRRDRYASAIDAMGSEILELTRDLFRPYNSGRRESTTSRSSGLTPESSTGPRSHRGSLVGAVQEITESSIEPPPGREPLSPGLPRAESTWWTSYMPSLSPIPSMSVSEAPDGSDSRGRPSSRWWELSQDGSTGTPSTRLEQRSKRESKYMGMPKELREALQYEDRDGQSGDSFGGGSSRQAGYAPDEYPPEKVGLYEQESMTTPVQTPIKSTAAFSPPPFTPNPNHLDVSRFVTLPPPFPRHHPAVNNNHPDLTSIRKTVRMLSDFAEVEETKGRFLTSDNKIEEEFAVAASQRRHSLRANIQRAIENGEMSYSDAANVENVAATSEAEKTKEASKASFELFQSQVVIPLNDLLMERIDRATNLFTELRSQLFVDAQLQSPNLTQEEGDEQPELLEKLTLLKWIFEAREQLHKGVFDLLSDRNDRYRDMVISPYALTGNQAKADSAKAFFAEDAGKRTLAFEQECLKRTEEFMDVIEENVVRGVEVQLSAFWDIAPNLAHLIDKIPRNLDGFNIQVPAAELEENPSYHEFPMQYLHSLLEHAEKSTYQFIESQTNLLCLLHEVKSVVTLANCRLMESQRLLQGEHPEIVKRELAGVERDEEKRLTDDLKEKVRCVEELWGEALGRSIQSMRSRVKRFLVIRGGWRDDEE